MGKVKESHLITRFNGENYGIWKLRIRAVLMDKGVLDVIDKKMPEKPDKKWKKRNYKARNIIMGYLDDSHVGIAENEQKTAREIFEELEDTYNRKTQASQRTIKKKLACLKLNDDTPLIKHLETFNEIVLELSAAGVKMTENDKIDSLLNSLSDKYDAVIVALETLSETNNNLSYVKNRLLDYEVKMKNKSCDTSMKVLVAQNDSENKFKNYYKGNFKQGFKSYKKNNKFNNIYKNHNSKKWHNGQNLTCYHCKKKGHKISECRYLKREILNNHQDQNSENKNKSSAQTTQ